MGQEMSDKLTRLLLVEDNPGDARLLQEALREVKNAQFELVHVERLSQALERLGEERFDIILLDLSLPDGKGLDTIVRVHEQTPRVPIVVLTGLDDEEMALRALREGAQDYLVKGQVDGSLLVRAMRYAVERKDAEELIQQHLKRITALRDINLATTSTLELSTVLNVLLEKIDLFLPYSSATVRLFNKESGLLEPVACRNLDEKEWKEEKWRGGRGLPNIIFETKTPMIIRNIQTDPRTQDPGFFCKHGLVSYLGVPLIVKDEILGVIAFYTKEECEFSKEEIQFLSTLAGQAAIAIHNARLYERTRNQATELERSNKVKDEFLSIMSHELRTPLNVVMGYVSMMMDGMLGEVNHEQKEALQKIITRARDQLTMISGILQATRMEAEGVKVESHEVNLCDFLDDLRRSCEVPWGKELTIKWDYPSDLPVVKTDGEKLKNILQNLINNAIKFTEKGSVTVSARYFPRKDTIEFKVADTGIGIEKEFFVVIFDRFRQVDSSETRPYGGVGVGLYIVKQYTELLGGKVEVESEVGKGSTFTVTIPCEIFPLAVGEQRLNAESKEIDA
jgi:signal transduction histidine kinase/DNA-binding response OmpR family regulator